MLLYTSATWAQLESIVLSFYKACMQCVNCVLDIDFLVCIFPLLYSFVVLRTDNHFPFCLTDFIYELANTETMNLMDNM